MNGPIFAWIAPRTHLIVQGSDAASFLQGQFTNDLRDATPGRWVYGLWLNQKGRVLADSFVLRRAADVFAVVSEATPAGTIRRRLEAYIVADDVTVEDATAGFGGLVLAGPSAADLLPALGLSVPGGGFFVEAHGAMAWPSRLTAGSAWQVIFPAIEAPVWRERMAALAARNLAREAAPEELARGRVAAGVASIPGEIGPGDLPNEAGLEHEAISYAKGCFLGQEVMARLRNLGRVRRRMFVVRWRGAGRPGALPARLVLAGTPVGELRCAFPDGAGDAWIGLAMLPLSRVSEGAELRFADPGMGDVAPPAVSVGSVASGRAWRWMTGESSSD